MSRQFSERLSAAVDNAEARDERARHAAEMIRDEGGYRWVGIYDVGDEEIAILGYTGARTPAHSSLGISEGLSGEAVRLRKTAVGNDVAQAVVPILGAESGVVIGTLDAESDRTGVFDADDVAFLEDCAAALRPLYD
ncbi:MAG: hypothetical protein JO030_01925 [Candidatus Eremiobacteraeota bacterium]|nr:hypothetical protein [Candidatus Eremiobacteraeota bacterium]